MAPGGETMAKIRMRSDIVPVDIQGDRLLGVRHGPLDVERIVVQTIHR